MKGSRTNVTDTLWRDRLKKGLSLVQKRVMWREGSHFLQPADELVFESDRYTIDGRIGAVLTISIQEGSSYKLPRAWGVNVIPSVSDPRVSVSLITSVGVVPEKDVIDKISGVKNSKDMMDDDDAVDIAFGDDSEK